MVAPRRAQSALSGRDAYTVGEDDDQNLNLPGGHILWLSRNVRAIRTMCGTDMDLASSLCEFRRRRRVRIPGALHEGLILHRHLFDIAQLCFRKTRYRQTIATIQEGFVHQFDRVLKIRDTLSELFERAFLSLSICSLSHADLCSSTVRCGFILLFHSRSSSFLAIIATVLFW